MQSMYLKQGFCKIDLAVSYYLKLVKLYITEVTNEEDIDVRYVDSIKFNDDN